MKITCETTILLPKGLLVMSVERDAHDPETSMLKLSSSSESSNQIEKHINVLRELAREIEARAAREATKI